MEDYKFEDTYRESWNAERLERFETRANAFVERVYRQMGWRLESDMVKSNNLKDSVWNDDDYRD